MLEKLLQIKHWQLFLLLLAPVVIMQLTLISTFPRANQISDMRSVFMIIPLVMLILLCVFFGWQYAIIFKLRDKMPQSVTLPYKRIKTFFFIPIIYMLAFLVFFSVAIGETELMPIVDPSIFVLIVPLHLFSMFCIMHSFYYAGKTIKCIETQRDQSFSDFAGEFFLIWFNIIGIWILQPRINNIFNNETMSYSTEILDDEII